jgi:rhodanese-related sulfurtransferase
MDAFMLYSQQNKPAPTNSSTVGITSLQRITRESLASRLLTSSPSDPSLAIIDVRDSDYIGGHIRGCTNVPSPSLDYRLPELVRSLRDKQTVVFHCALSQQRGPGAALRYLRERERLGLLDEEVVKGAVTADMKKEGGEGEADVVESLDNKDGSETVEKKVTQKVYVLDGGFVKWQEK